MRGKARDGEEYRERDSERELEVHMKESHKKQKCTSGTESRRQEVEADGLMCFRCQI